MPGSTDKSLIHRIPKEISSLQRGDNHLFVIGINAYRQLGKLENAVRDAQAFRDVLLERYRFEASHVTELYDAQANRRNIMRELRGLVGELKPEDSLIIYFSGHGHFDPVLQEGHWVPVDATYDVIDDYIPYNFLQQIARAIPARHLLMIVDSCYSGAVLVRERDAVKERFERDPSRWLIASGRNEVVPDGSLIDRNHSPFAKELLDLLRNYSEEGLTTQMLIARLTENVSYNSKQTPIGQALQAVGHQGGQFVFYPRKNEARDWATAQQTNTVAAYSQFLQSYPQSAHADEAAWQLASLQHTKSAYRQYIDHGGNQVQEAIQRLGSIEEKEKFERAKRKGESALLKFMVDFPQSDFRAQAQAEIARIRAREREPEALRDRQDGGTKEARARKAPEQQAQERQQAKEEALRRKEEKRAAAVPLLQRPPVRYGLIGLPILILLIWGIPKLRGSKTNPADWQTYSRLIQKADSTFQVGRNTHDLKTVEHARNLYTEAKRLTDSPKPKERIQAVNKWVRTYNDSLKKPVATAPQTNGLERTGTEDIPSQDPVQLLIEQGYRIVSNWHQEVAIYEKGSSNKVMGLVNKDAQLLGTPYYKVEELANGYAIFHKGGKRGYLDLQGKEVVAARFDAAWPFDRSGQAKVKEGSKTFYINTSGVCVKGCEEAVAATTPTPIDQIPIPKMKRIAGGTFLMGDTNSSPEDEKPVHKVTVNSFEIGVYEVTQKEWKAVMGSNPSYFKCDNCPVELVSWDNVQKYIRKLNQLTSSNFRLPTEAEWEYAAGGGMIDRNSDGSRKYTFAGGDNLDSYGWNKSNSGSKTHPIGQKRPNGLGLYDMSGNVWEWCQDWYGSDYYSTCNSLGTVSNPQGPNSSTGRVLRGGSWDSGAFFYRVADRYGISPDHRNSDYGFRLARTL